MNCRHCGKPDARRSRGLCWTCYDTKSIRLLYQSKDAVPRSFGDGPTLAELDAIIAEQRKCLPPWWAAEHAKMRAVDGVRIE